MATNSSNEAIVILVQWLRYAEIDVVELTPNEDSGLYNLVIRGSGGTADLAARIAAQLGVSVLRLRRLDSPDAHERVPCWQLELSA